MIRITLPDESVLEFDRPVAVAEVAARIGRRLARDAVGALVDGAERDLTHLIERDASVRILTPVDPAGLEIMRHSASHVMAEAILKLFPGTQLVYGPPIEDGFYYDVDPPEAISVDDLPRIEEVMRRIVKENAPFARREMTRKEAAREVQGNPYKEDNLARAKGDTISFYSQGGGFSDLCAGPHVPSTGRIGAFKLLNVSGAYFHGDASAKQLTRLYGTSFATGEELDLHLERLEQAKQRDHRKLGRTLELFEFHPEAPGMAFWRPRGTVLYNALVDYTRELCLRNGYEEIRTPTLLVKDLWVSSGHWANYQDKMYLAEKDGREFGIKPMNCPGGIVLYKAGLHSHNDLPLRWAEFGHVHRYEGGGEIHGLVRVRGFTQDDAHIFCTPEQLKDEIKGCIRLVFEMNTLLGLDFDHIELSTQPAKHIGSDVQWSAAEEALKQALEELDIAFILNPGEGAFYGPKIDFHLADALGRTWQLSTIQVDFAMPENFDMSYIDAESARKRPVMIHRVIAGSLERLIGILVEHYGGDFPLWLAPEQVRVLAITDAQKAVAEKAASRLREAGLRVGVDLGHEKIGAKIRRAELLKIPYLAVVGAREAASGAVSLRRRHRGNLGSVALEELARRLAGEAGSRALPQAVAWEAG
ncbi:MAG: threonine--tRNA ligase [Planctomycetota bacterium]